MNATEQIYRKTAAEGASGFGLLIALYDTLAGDLRRAAEAERNNNLEKRAAEVKHALLVIGYLEDWIDHGSGGELAHKLVAFYRTMRKKMLEAQVRRVPEIFEEQMALVLAIRGTWQDLELRAASALEGPPPPGTQAYPGAGEPTQGERSVSSWSA
jgi:flagellar protein FliS